MNEPQPEPEMDWEEPSSTEPLMNAEENTTSTVSVVSSALYADESVIEKGKSTFAVQRTVYSDFSEIGINVDRSTSGTYSCTI